MKFIELNKRRYNETYGYSDKTVRGAFNLDNVVMVMEEEKGTSIVGTNGAVYSVKESYDEVIKIIEHMNIVEQLKERG